MSPKPASAQKFFRGERPPRVQIEMIPDVSTNKKVELPFVVGVLADLSGMPTDALPEVADRKFIEFTGENFDDRMRALKPRVAMQVPNTLTGQGNVAVELTFDSMDTFTPAAIARAVEPLRKLLDAREELNNLLSYMDGKSKAEDLLRTILEDPQLRALASGTTGSDKA